MIWTKDIYLKQELWLGDPFLVTPYQTSALPTIGATKKCRCCGKIKFTAEFANVDIFVDRKLPVCNKCYGKRKDTKAQKIIADTGHKAKCKKCKMQKSLSDFAVKKINNGLYDVCRQCNKNPLFA